MTIKDILSASYTALAKMSKNRLLKALQSLREKYIKLEEKNNELKVEIEKLNERVKDQKIKIWYDDSDHKPYCLSDQTIATLKENTSLAEHSGLDHFDTITKYNALKDQKVSMSLVVAKDPLSIGGRPSGTIRDIIRVWEADIKYVENYLYDRDLEPGMPYDIRDGKLHKIKTSIPQNIANNLANIVFKEYKKCEMRN